MVQSLSLQLFKSSNLGDRHENDEDFEMISTPAIVWPQLLRPGCCENCLAELSGPPDSGVKQLSWICSTILRGFVVEL